MTKETPIGAEKIALGEAAGATGVPIELGNWWSRLGGGFVTPAMFWAPDRVDAVPRSEHVPFLFWLVDALRPMALVELVEAPSASYLGLCQAVSRLRLPTRCYAISGSGTSRDERTQYHNARYAQFSQFLPAEQMFERCEDGTIDLISIDAMERGALAQHYRAWLPKLSKSAIMLVHGIDDPAIATETLELWHVLAEKYPHFEFVHGGGLGVLGIGEDLPPALQHLFSLDATATRALEVREMFARLGGMVAIQAELTDVRRRLHAALDSDQVAKLESALSAAKDALAAARVDHVKTLKRLRKVEESIWWRITKPARRLVKNHRWAIYNMRQWAMCAYWITTFRFARMKKQMKPYRHAKLVLRSGLMHEAWYLRQYPDVAAVGIPPALHYVLYGGFEGRDPSPMFSSQAYLEAYPDVRVMKTNPLVHYLQKGRYENRTISPSTAKPPLANGRR
ncbi:class I SAM-dependent methyltransferase [Dongia deserti]|uniref:class I SAM-dependent methyltransferase n=1 Tax=Dongia deserti TaxID=2268030 RepID=UPI0013C477A3|nr:class I SAM-dependent methyltransferase [Dongia deserti]